MNTSYRRSSSFNIPGYSQNAVLQLIVASGVGFILFTAARVTLEVFGFKSGAADTAVIPAVGLAPMHEYARHWWTIFTYGWVHYRFFDWLSNMIWLYTFGNVVQNLIGYRQVIPTYLYGITLGGVFYLAAQAIPGIAPVTYLMSGSAGVMALAAATITLSPKYRFYIGDNFSIPLLVVVGIYLALNLLVYATNLPLLLLGVGGLLAGYATMTLLKQGYQPGAWMYSLTSGIGNSMTPDDAKLRKLRNRRRQQVMHVSRRQPDKSEVTQHRVDEILEKIHQRGYASLTAEEREMLLQASKETQD